LKAGFAQADIAPPLGAAKIGWIKLIIIKKILDPPYARVAVFESGSDRLGIVQLDTLCSPASLTARIRARIERDSGFPASHIMVAATHNHAGPAVANEGEVKRDEAYVESMLGKISEAFKRALADLSPAEIGWTSVAEHTLPRNRRVMMRDGTTKTHGRLEPPEALCIEGPVDPELGILAARGADGKLKGLIVNFACHPTDYGGEEICSAGFPGVLANRMARYGSPVTVFLNGAAGNITTSDPARGGAAPRMEQAGETLAAGVRKALQDITFRASARLGSASKEVSLPYRKVTEEEIKGTVFGAQRFIDSALYDKAIPGVLERIKARGVEKAEVQALRFDELVLVSLPAEPFVELGLRIKEGAHPKPAWVVGYANGMVGYVPHAAAFARGGYETTFGDGCFLAPAAGDELVQAALDVVKVAEE
jgi:neutral ceramidase